MLISLKAMFGIYRHLDFVNKGNKKKAYSQTILHFFVFWGLMIFTEGFHILCCDRFQGLS